MCMCVRVFVNYLDSKPPRHLIIYHWAKFEGHKPHRWPGAEENGAKAMWCMGRCVSCAAVSYIHKQHT